MTPEFEVKSRPRGDRGGPEMVICTLTHESGFKFIGAARVFSAGVLDATHRAEAQARGKAVAWLAERDAAG